MGVFHGFYFGTFLQQTAMDSLYMLSGVALAEALLLLLFALALARLTKAAAWLRPVQAGAVVLFLIGMAWFLLRIRS
jgi:hydrogenase/urease accessory protein HupE